MQSFAVDIPDSTAALGKCPLSSVPSPFFLTAHYRFDIKRHVEGDPRAFYQAFRSGRAARKWYRCHKKFRIDLGQFPVADGMQYFKTVPPAPLAPADSFEEADEVKMSTD